MPTTHGSARSKVSVRAMCLCVSICIGSAAIAQTPPPTAFKVIHAFGVTENALPTGWLTQAQDGTLFGVSTGGGTFGQGAIFTLSTTGQYAVIHSFGSASPAAQSPDGRYPSSGLALAPDGNLYGTTPQSGANDGGTAFRITPAGAFTTLVAFGGGNAAGTEPLAPLALGSDGNFYGTTYASPNGAGAVFRLSPGGAITVLHEFASDGSEGEQATGAIARTADGSVYGTTSIGGFNQTEGDGTVFKIDPNGVFSILYFFPYTATNAISGLTPSADGTFYGITLVAPFYSGEAFSITPVGTFSVLHNFGCSCGTPDGSEPVGSLTLASDGYFYGVTAYGGTSNHGTIFRMTPAGEVTPLHSFSGADGDDPAGGVIEGLDGRFYGMTSGVFTHIATIYSLTLPPFVAPASAAAFAADGSVSLSWSAGRGATSYNVYQGAAPGAESATPVLTGVTSLSAAIKGLKDGTTYYFQIAVVNEAGVGPLSAEISSEPIGAPTSLQATPMNGAVSLSWAAGAGAASYNVYLGTAPGGPGKI